MVKRLRENRKNKKGFTLVELIVVIVIILVLAAVMVPSVIKYVDKANKANTKSEAATALIDVQAQVADYYANLEAGGAAIGDLTVSGNVTVKKSATLLAAKGNGRAATYTVVETTPTTDDGTDIGDVTSFSYQDGKHWVQWSLAQGWAEVDKPLATTAP